MALLLGGYDTSTSSRNELDESRGGLLPGDIIEQSTKSKKVRVKQGESKVETGHFILLHQSTVVRVNPDAREVAP